MNINLETMKCRHFGKMNALSIHLWQKDGDFEYIMILYDIAIIISACIKSGHILQALETTYFYIYITFGNNNTIYSN